MFLLLNVVLLFSLPEHQQEKSKEKDSRKGIAIFFQGLIHLQYSKQYQR